MSLIVLAKLPGIVSRTIRIPAPLAPAETWILPEKRRAGIFTVPKA
jgi:hypothetical protein